MRLSATVNPLCPHVAAGQRGPTGLENTLKPDLEPTMNSSTRTSILISTLAAIACLSASVSAQAQATAPSVCPASYFKLDTIWYNAVTKDVVTASTGATDIADRNGWILGDLCQHDATGYVQIFDRKAPSPGRTSAVPK